MQRRDFIKLLSMTGLSSALLPNILQAAPLTPYTGTFYMNLAAQGGWDVTSYCDPKMNPVGEPVMNHWAQTGEIQTISGSPIQYAPFANNQLFFEKYHRHMLVVNGVDAQTNSHDAGVRHNWSGRLSSGYPAFPALIANNLGDNLPLAYLSGGGYRETAKLVPFSLIQNPGAIHSLVRSNKPRWVDTPFVNEDELAIIKQFQRERLVGLMDQASLPKQRRRMDFLLDARDSRDGMERLLAILPENFVNETELATRLGEDNLNSIRYDANGNDQIWGLLNTFQQIQVALLAYKAGLCVSCDLVVWGFDTHDNHDVDQAMRLSILNLAVDYLFEYAAELEVQDKIFLTIGSDFGRTPHYNDDNGKDHWSVGSFIFMQHNAPWANRVVGVTDELHNAIGLNAATLQADPTGAGVILRPKHIHQALHQLAGISQDPIVQQFDLGAEAMDLFQLS